MIRPMEDLVIFAAPWAILVACNWLYQLLARPSKLDDDAETYSFGHPNDTFS